MAQQNPFSDWSQEEIESLREIVNAHEQPDGVSRRDALKAMGLLGTGALIGGGGATQLIEEASAASNQVGQIGDPSNLVDVYAEDIDAVSVGADELLTTFYTSTRGSDGAAIQSALDDAAAVGGPARVVVDPIDSAPYLVDGAAPLLVSSQTEVVLREVVELAGGVQENVFQNVHHFDDSTDDTDIIFRSEGGYIDGNKSNNSIRATDSTGYGIGSKQNGVSLGGVQRVRIDGLDSRDNIIHGVSFTGADHVRVSDGYTSGNRYAGINSHYRMTDDRLNTHVIIADNTVMNGGQNGGESAGIYVSGHLYHTVEGNHVEGRDNHGISVASRTTGWNGWTKVVDNTVIDVAATTTYYPQRGGIMLPTGTGAGVPGLKQVTVEGNTVDTTGAANNNQHGIAVLCRGNLIERLNIENNTVNSQNSAIYVKGNANRNIEALTVHDNNVTTAVDADARGIELVDVGVGTVTDNVASYCQASGIALRGVDSAGVSTIGVTGNMCYANGQNGAATDTYGLYSQDGANCSVTGNMFRGWSDNVQTHGIYEEAAFGGTLYALNDLRGNVTAAHSLGGTGTITDPVGGGTAEDWNVT